MTTKGQIGEVCFKCSKGRGYTETVYLCDLHASAEDLLEALKNLLAHHRVKSLPDTDTLTPRLEAARAAILKAEGGPKP